MTRKEKEKILYKYCKSKKCKCEKCTLNHTNFKWSTECFDCFDTGYKCASFKEISDHELNKALKLIQDSKDLDKAHDTSKLKEAINHPHYYNDGKIEVIDFIEDKKLGFHLGNAVKYIARAGKKYKDKEAEDIKKAIWYLNRYLGGK